MACLPHTRIGRPAKPALRNLYDVYIDGLKRGGARLYLSLVTVLMVLIVVMRVGVGNSFVGMLVCVLFLRVGLVIMRMIVVPIVMRMLVRMGNPLVSMGMRMICHLGLLCGLHPRQRLIILARECGRSIGVADMLMSERHDLHTFASSPYSLRWSTPLQAHDLSSCPTHLSLRLRKGPR